LLVGLLASARRARAGLGEQRGTASTAHFGRRYLAAHPDEADVAVLADHLGLAPEALAALSRGRPLPAQAGRALQKLRDAELRAGRTVLLDGWLFARSEARCCALAWLTAAG
jgi:hypothetical protein